MKTIRKKAKEKVKEIEDLLRESSRRAKERKKEVYIIKASMVSKTRKLSGVLTPRLHAVVKDYPLEEKEHGVKTVRKKRATIPQKLEEEEESRGLMVFLLFLEKF